MTRDHARTRLIVNADDFGFTRDVNEGIVEAHCNGILTATTLMANGEAFEHAVALARETPSLDVGCHLVLVQGRSVLDSSRNLPATLKDLGLALMRRQIPVYEEFAAQVRKIVGAGVTPTHLDTHKHTHVLPPVLKAVTRVAREFGIRWVRRGLLRASVPEGLRMTDHFTGFRATGSLDTESLANSLGRLPEGLTEFMCHPGKFGTELRNAPTRLRESREIELMALTSREAREAIERRRIQLVNYRILDATESAGFKVQ